MKARISIWMFALLFALALLAVAPAAHAQVVGQPYQIPAGYPDGTVISQYSPVIRSVRSSTHCTAAILSIQAWVAIGMITATAPVIVRVRRRNGYTITCATAADLEDDAARGFSGHPYPCVVFQILCRQFRFGTASRG